MAQSLAGIKIRTLRERRGLTQSELARRVGISASYLNLIERNKRAVAGGLMNRIAAGLGVARSELDGNAERHIVETLEEIATDPAFAVRTIHPGPAEDLVGRTPGWASFVLALHHAWREQTQAVLALADRLNRDPFLSESVHLMLTNATSIRAAAEILQADDDLAPADRKRFLGIVADDAQRLSATGRALLDFFDSAHMRVRSATPEEHVDAFILAADNYFPDLESLASRFLAACRPGEGAAAAAERVLAERNRLPPEPSVPPSAEERRFRLVKEALRDDAADAVEAIVAIHPALASEESQRLAASALQAYAAAAVLMPYERFLEAAERQRYDLDALMRLFGVSYEQAAHRLATLRRPGAEGVRFAFMRSDISGYVTKRLPLPRLPLPRYSNACPLWVIHAAFQTPGATVRHFGQLPSGERFLFFARAVEKQPAAVAHPRRLLSVMLACTERDAARVTYGDGIERTTATVRIGTTCRLCPRTDCGHRQEAPLIA